MTTRESGLATAYVRVGGTCRQAEVHSSAKKMPFTKCAFGCSRIKLCSRLGLLSVPQQRGRGGGLRDDGGLRDVIKNVLRVV